MNVIVFGVSGVGKTTIGKLLAEQLGWQFYEADDFHPRANIEKMRSGRPLTDEDRWPWLERLREQITRSITAKDNAVLACSALKRAYRDRLRVSDDVTFVFLRGDYALIAEQLRHRRPTLFSRGPFGLRGLVRMPVCEAHAVSTIVIDPSLSCAQVVESSAGW